jgi:hypothetical protein
VTDATSHIHCSLPDIYVKLIIKHFIDIKSEKQSVITESELVTQEGLTKIALLMKYQFTQIVLLTEYQ